MAKPKRFRKSQVAAPGNNGSFLPPLPEGLSDDDGVSIAIGTDDLNDNVPVVDPNTNTVEYNDGDGNITIQFADDEDDEKETHFDDNLAEEIDEFELGRIAEQLLEGIETDRRSYAEWVQERADGLELLGQKVEKPGSGNVGSSSIAVAGQSTVRDALLAEACDRFQANAFAELCPSEGPVKVVCYGQETAEKDELAENLERDFNFYLTGSGGRDTATEYYPDTRRMLWWVGYASGMFKKVYWCPLRNRPVSEAVDGTDLIVNAQVTDLHNAGRITHQIKMRQSVMKRMQILGVYRDVVLQNPLPTLTPLEQKTADITGGNPSMDRPEDQDYTIFESYCELDIVGFEHKQGNKKTGLALPYRVTLEKDSRKILEIRRNWKEDPDEGDDDDEDDEEGDPLPVAKIPFVAFSYSTGLGFYGTGLLHRLGNYAMAITAMLRECIDSGMFASFPGFLFAKPAGRQLQNEFRVPPGGGAPIDVSGVGGDINKAVLPLPYKDVSTAFVGLMSQTREVAQRYGGTADAPTGEGVANAPVGSVLAAIDQATRIEGGVHKALYASQREELGLLLDLIRERPEALWRGNKRPALGTEEAMRKDNFMKAIQAYDLVPASDPNVPSHMHRLAKANAYLQTAMMIPVFNMQRVVLRWAKMVKIDGVEADLAPPQQAQPDPVAMADLAIKKQNADTQAMKAAQQNEHNKKLLESKENIEAMKMAQSASLAGDKGQAQPDPFRADDIALKQKQLDLNQAKQADDSFHKTKDRESKESIEALKIAQALAVHPTSDAVVDQEMQDMAPLITPMRTSKGGGAINAPTSPDEAKKFKLAEIERVLMQDLQHRRGSEYRH